jgi:hypothetical protein
LFKGASFLRKKRFKYLWPSYFRTKLLRRRFILYKLHKSI